MGIPEGEEKEKGFENIFEEIMAENFPNLKETVIKIQETQEPFPVKRRMPLKEQTMKQTSSV